MASEQSSVLKETKKRRCRTIPVEDIEDQNPNGNAEDPQNQDDGKTDVDIAQRMDDLKLKQEFLDMQRSYKFMMEQLQQSNEDKAKQMALLEMEKKKYALLEKQLNFVVWKWKAPEQSEVDKHQLIDLNLSAAMEPLKIYIDMDPKTFDIGEVDTDETGRDYKNTKSKVLIAAKNELDVFAQIQKIHTNLQDCRDDLLETAKSKARNRNLVDKMKWNNLGKTEGNIDKLENELLQPSKKIKIRKSN